MSDEPKDPADGSDDQPEDEPGAEQAELPADPAPSGSDVKNFDTTSPKKGTGLSFDIFGDMKKGADPLKGIVPEGLLDGFRNAIPEGLINPKVPDFLKNMAAVNEPIIPEDMYDTAFAIDDSPYRTAAAAERTAEATEDLYAAMARSVELNEQTRVDQQRLAGFTRKISIASLVISIFGVLAAVAAIIVSINVSGNEQPQPQPTFVVPSPVVTVVVVPPEPTLTPTP